MGWMQTILLRIVLVPLTGLVVSRAVLAVANAYGWHPELQLARLLLASPELLQTEWIRWAIVALFALLLWGICDYAFYRRRARNDRAPVVLQSRDQELVDPGLTVDHASKVEAGDLVGSARFSFEMFSGKVEIIQTENLSVISIENTLVNAAHFNIRFEFEAGSGPFALRVDSEPLGIGLEEIDGTIVESDKSYAKVHFFTKSATKVYAGVPHSKSSDFKVSFFER
jgi:hypothetical protein